MLPSKRCRPRREEITLGEMVGLDSLRGFEAVEGLGWAKSSKEEGGSRKEQRADS